MTKTKNELNKLVTQAYQFQHTISNMDLFEYPKMLHEHEIRYDQCVNLMTHQLNYAYGDFTENNMVKQGLMTTMNNFQSIRLLILAINILTEHFDTFVGTNSLIISPLNPYLVMWWDGIKNRLDNEEQIEDGTFLYGDNEVLGDYPTKLSHVDVYKRNTKWVSINNKFPVYGIYEIKCIDNPKGTDNTYYVFDVNEYLMNSFTYEATDKAEIVSKIVSAIESVDVKKYDSLIRELVKEAFNWSDYTVMSVVVGALSNNNIISNDTICDTDEITFVFDDDEDYEFDNDDDFDFDDEVERISNLLDEISESDDIEVEYDPSIDDTGIRGNWYCSDMSTMNITKLIDDELEDETDEYQLDVINNVIDKLSVMKAELVTRTRMLHVDSTFNRDNKIENSESM